MNAHLEIEANGKPLALPENFSIDIEDANPLFNDSEMYTFPVSLPLDGNRHLVENMEDIHADLRPVSLEHTPMRIKVDGIPFRSGVAVIDDSQEIKDQVSFSIQSMKESLEDRIANLNCRDVPVKDKIQIGEMIGEVEVDLKYNAMVYVLLKETDKPSIGGAGVPVPINPKGQVEGDYFDEVKVEVPLQALGFSAPFEANERPVSLVHEAERKDGFPSVKRDFINVSDADSFPYCNTRVCYKHYKTRSDQGDEGELDISGEFTPYYVLDARRPQSGINFYVMYFLDCLFDYLKVSYDSSGIAYLEDMKRLFFFNTACKYDLERKYSGAKDFTSLDDINKWIASRADNEAHCGKLEFDMKGGKQLKSIVLDLQGDKYLVKTDDYTELPPRQPGKPSTWARLESGKTKVLDYTYSVSANIMRMYANSDNFPNESVSTIIDSLWCAFGMKFVYNYESNAMRPVFIRDVYRDSSAPIDFPCSVISCVNVAEKKTGFRMRYSAESDKKEQEKNVKHGVRDYDTNFDYIDYRKVNTALSYDAILQKRSATDETTYVDLHTGNAYRLKVDKDAETVTELNARVFEVGGYNGISVGDCSPLNEDFVEDYVIGFSPMLFTDANISNELGVGSDRKFNGSCAELGGDVKIDQVNDASRDQILAAFLDEDMQHENDEMLLENSIGSDFADAVLRERITTDESYDPTGTEDGNSPLQHADWGCAVGIMRGGGSDATLQEYDYNYDGFGNSKWRMVSASYDSSSDSIDNWGNEYDYNTSQMEGLGGEQFSLKIRGYKTTAEGEVLFSGSEVAKNRGLYDKFMSDHANFLLNRKKYKIRCLCEIAALADIPNHWDKRYNVGGIVGWINRISSSVSEKEGLGIVEIEMYSM